MSRIPHTLLLSRRSSQQPEAEEAPTWSLETTIGTSKHRCLPVFEATSVPSILWQGVPRVNATPP